MVAHIILVTKEYPDPREMDPYFRGVAETMARYGGGYQAVPRHRVTRLEGDWLPPKGITILEFPSYDQALAWYQSPEYAPLLALRTNKGRFDTILVDGVSADDPVSTGKPDPWEIERIAELEALEALEAREQ